MKLIVGGLGLLMGIALVLWLSWDRPTSDPAVPKRAITPLAMKPELQPETEVESREFVDAAKSGLAHDEDLEEADPAPLLSSEEYRPKHFEFQAVDPDGNPVNHLGIDFEVDTPGARGALLYQTVTVSSAGRAGLVPPCPVDRLSHAATILARPRILAKECTEVEFVCGPEPAVLRLRVPHSAKLRVRAIGPDKQPIAESIPATVSVHKRKPRPPPQRAWSRGILEVQSNTIMKSGAALFDHVGLGTRLTVEIGPSSRYAMTRIEVDGPTTVGELRSIDVTMDRQGPRLRVRLLTPEGDPIVGRRILVRRDSIDGKAFPSLGTIPCRTDQTGVLDLPLDHPFFEDIASFERIVFALPDGSMTETDVTPPAPGQNLELGELRFRAASILVAGIVVDERGIGVPDVEVTCAVDEPELTTGRRLPLGRPVSVNTESDGTFTIAGHLAASRLSVTASRPQGSTSAPSIVETGTTGIRIVLSNDGSIEGMILAPPQEKPLPLWVQARLDDGGGLVDFHVRVVKVTAKSNTFEIKDLRPGRYRLSVAAGRVDGVPLFEVSDLIVESAQACRDPRINPLDLRTTMRKLRVRVTDQGDNPIENSVLHVANARSLIDSRLKCDAEGWVEIWAGSDDLSAVASCPGHELSLSLALESETTIRLVPRRSVRVFVPSAFDVIPPSKGKWVVMILPEETAWKRFTSSVFPKLLRQTPLEWDGSAVVPVLFGGPATIRLSNSAHFQTSIDSFGIPPTPSSFVIPNTGPVPDLHLSVTAADLERALKTK